MSSCDPVEYVGVCYEADLDLSLDCEHIVLPEVDSSLVDGQGRLIAHVDLDAFDGAVHRLCPVTCESERIASGGYVATLPGSAGSRIAFTVQTTGEVSGLSENLVDITVSGAIDEDRSAGRIGRAEQNAASLCRHRVAIDKSALHGNSSVSRYECFVDVVVCAADRLLCDIGQNIKAGAGSGTVKYGLIEFLCQFASWAADTFHY